MSDGNMTYEDWLRGCVHHDGRHGYVTLSCDEVLKIADFIEKLRADRKTESNSEKPNNCDTCKHNKLEWYSEVCDGCSKAHSNYEPKDEPQVVMPKECKGCDSASKIIEAYSRGFEDGAETVKAVAIKAFHKDYIDPYVTIEDEPQERNE